MVVNSCLETLESRMRLNKQGEEVGSTGERKEEQMSSKSCRHKKWVTCRRDLGDSMEWAEAARPESRW